MPSVLVVSLGNVLMKDEGIGVHLLEALRRNAPEGLEFLDSGNSGMRILHSLEGRRRVLFLDCAFMDLPPGSMRVFTPAEVRTRKVLPRLSLHEGDLMQTLEMAERLGILPPEVILVGFQPGSVEPGEGLSPPLRERFDSYVKALLDLARNPASGG